MTISWSHMRTKKEKRTIIDNYPSAGEAGVKGASGCVVVYWERDAQ